VDTGDELVVPVASAAVSARPQRYAVRRGDTLVTVADRFGVSVEELRRWNRLASNTVKPGASLMVAEPVKLAPGMHVRGKGARSKSGSHVATANVHAGSMHGGTKHTSSKGRVSSTAGKKSSTATKQSVSSKTKQKATR
jgi:membrane-bound lytic murein transglycosylase D